MYADAVWWLHSCVFVLIVAVAVAVNGRRHFARVTFSARDLFSE